MNLKKVYIDCEKFTCRKFLNWYNPKIGFFKSSVARIGSLFLRKTLGDRKWKKLLKKYDEKVAYFGHHFKRQ